MRRSLRNGLMVAVLTASLAGGVVGCESDQRGTGDAPVADRKGDDTPAHVTNMPDQFSNVAAKCLAGFPGKAVAVNTKEAPVVVFDAPAGMCR
jgi:hypothetical protein